MSLHTPARSGTYMRFREWQSPCHSHVYSDKEWSELNGTKFVIKKNLLTLFTEHKMLVVRSSGHERLIKD